MRIIALLFCFLAASVVQAKDMKVGTVELKKLFSEYPGTKKAQKKFIAMAEKKKKDLIESEQELSDLQKELKGSSSVLSAKQRKAKETEYKTMLQDLQQKETAIQNDLQNKESEMTGAILDEIKELVAKAAKDKGVDLVLDAEKTVYVKDGIDLTKDVLSNYKKDASKDDDSDSKK